MKKKELDIKALVKGSVLKAQKEYGLLTEAPQTQPAAKRQREPFDPEKHMPKIQIASATWGQKGSLDALELDRYIKPIAKGSGDFKTFLKNFNLALGITYGNSKTPVYAAISKEDMTLQKVVSSLVLRQLMASMITKNSAKTAGDVWEGFFARILESSLPDKSPIEDIREPDPDGNYISLKLLEHNGEVDFSVRNLAIGIAKASDVSIVSSMEDPTEDDLNSVSQRGVKYIIGEKLQTDESVIGIKFFSFIVNRSNFFQVALGMSNPRPIDIYNLIQSISKFDIAAILDDEERAKAESGKVEKIAGQPGTATYSTDKYKKFVQTFLYPKSKDSKEYIFLGNLDPQRKKDYEENLKGILNKIFKNEFAKDALAAVLALEDSENTYEKVFKEFVTPSKMSDLQTSNFGRSKILRLLNYGYTPETAKQERGYEESEKDELRRYIFTVMPSLYDSKDEEKRKQVDAILQQARADEHAETTKLRNDLKARLTQEKQFSRKLIGSLANLFDQLYGEFLQNFSKEKRIEYDATISASSTAITNEQVRRIIITFWENLAPAGTEHLSTDRFSKNEGINKRPLLREQEDTEDIKKPLKTQALLRSNIVDVDESYDPIYLDSKELFISTRETVNIFKEYAEPIYRDRYEMDMAIEKYFIDDEPSGMSELEVAVNNMDRDVSAIKEKIGDKKASEIAPEQDVAMKESLNRDSIDDILDLL